MSANRLEEGGTEDQEDELARTAELFLEADRLDAVAYAILEGDSENTETWRRFTEAKAIAEAKRTEANHALMRMRRQGNDRPIGHH